MFVFLCAYVIASNVSTVYSCSIDTIFLCAFKDLKENGTPKYLSNDLRRCARGPRSGSGLGPGLGSARGPGLGSGLESG